MLEQDWTKVYKLVNKFSHNYDPLSMIEHKDKSESQEAIGILLEIVQKSDSKYVSVLKKVLLLEHVRIHFHEG